LPRHQRLPIRPRLRRQRYAHQRPPQNAQRRPNPQLGVKSIDLLVGTHPHADHIGQFPEVLKAFPVKEVWLSGDTNTTKTFEDALDAIAASGAAMVPTPHRRWHFYWQ
jgi:beta-lactamase superfamily II metal-dependent hydrolase